MKHDHPGERSPFIDSEDDYWTHQVFKTSVTINNSPIQDYAQTGDLAPPNYKLFSLLNVLTICFSYSILNNKYLITTQYYENWKFICAVVYYKYQTTTVIYKLYSSLKLPHRNTVFLSTSSLLQIPDFTEIAFLNTSYQNS